MSFGPTVGITGFGSGLTTRYESANAVCRGGAAFTVFVALQTRIPYSAARQIIAGNYTGGSGWYLERTVDVAGGVQYVFNISVGPTQLAVEIPFSSAFGRTLLLGLTVDDNGFIAAAYANGAQVAFASYGAAFVPGASVLRIGGDGLTLGPQDRIISFGYTNRVLTPEQMALVFDDFRNTSLRTAASEVLGLPLQYSYEASDISVPPQSAPPATWPNGGSAGIALLSWQGPTTNIPDLFTTDRNPDFGGAASQGGGGGGGAPINLYLSGANGNDANDGLTPATARATVEGIFELFPATLYGPLVVHVGAAGVVGDDVAYDWASMPVPTQANATARIWIYGDGAGQPGEDGFEEITTGVCGAGTTAQQITLAAPVVANVYQHFTLEMLDGPAVGYRRTVQQNTTTQIWPVRQFDNVDGATGVGTTPVVGNTFRILRPSVIVDGIDTLEGQPGFLGGIGGGDGYAPLFLVNIAFAAATAAVEINDCSIYMAGVEFRGSRFPAFSQCTGSIGWWDNLQTGLFSRYVFWLPRSAEILRAKAEWFDDIGESTALAQLAAWRGWGVSCVDVVTTGDGLDVMSFYGCAIGVVGTFGSAESAGCAQMGLGGFFWSGLTCRANTYCAGLPQNITTVNGMVFRGKLLVSDAATFTIFAQINSALSTVGNAVDVKLTSTCFLGDVATISVSGGVGSWCVNVVDGSRFSAWNGMVISGGGAGSGIRAYNNSLCFDMYSITGTALSAGLQLINSVYASQYAGAISLACSGIPLGLYRESSCDLSESVAISSGTNIEVTQHSTLTLNNSNFTANISGSLTLTHDATLLQRAGVLSITSSTATALSCTDSSVSLLACTFVGGAGTAVSLTNSRFKNTGVLSTTGLCTLTQGSSVIFAGAATIGGALSASASSVRVSAALSCTTSCSLQASALTHSANFTVTGAVANAISLTHGSSWQQTGGTLSSVATAGVGMSLASESKAFLSGVGNTILTGAGGGTVGMRCTGGSRGWFNAAPTSVTGPAGADLAVGGSVAVANATLGAANNFITDTDVTGLLGGGNVIGRAA